MKATSWLIQLFVGTDNIYRIESLFLWLICEQTTTTATASPRDICFLYNRQSLRYAKRQSISLFILYFFFFLFFYSFRCKEQLLQYQNISAMPQATQFRISIATKNKLEKALRTTSIEIKKMKTTTTTELNSLNCSFCPQKETERQLFVFVCVWILAVRRRRQSNWCDKDIKWINFLCAHSSIFLIPIDFVKKKNINYFHVNRFVSFRFVIFSLAGRFVVLSKENFLIDKELNKFANFRYKLFDFIFHSCFVRQIIKIVDFLWLRCKHKRFQWIWTWLSRFQTNTLLISKVYKLHICFHAEAKWQPYYYH